MEQYAEIKAEYLRISSATRNKLTVLSATIIAAIYFFYTAVNSNLLKWAFVFYVLTILSEIVSGYLTSQHYSLWFDKKIKSIDFRESNWGEWAERFFWVPIIFFVLGTIIFGFGLFKVPA